LRVGIDKSLGVPKTQLIGSGEATVFTGGVVAHGTWSKGAPTEPIRLVDEDGVVIRLAPGNTWIELVPLGGSVSVDGS
jgi:allantoicase